MGVLIDGTWRAQEELPQEIGRAGEFKRVDGSAIGSPPTATRVSRQRLAAIISMPPMAAPGLTEH